MEEKVCEGHNPEKLSRCCLVVHMPIKFLPLGLDRTCECGEIVTPLIGLHYTTRQAIP